MQENPYPVLSRATYSEDEGVNEWAKNYLSIKAEYYDELYERVTAIASPDDAILEIGAVPCQFTYLLDAGGYDVTGFDLDPSRIAPFTNEHGLDVLECDIEREKFPIESNTVDVVLLTEVLEHLRINPLHTVREIRRVLRPGGVLYLTTPNQYNIQRLWDLVHGKGTIPFAHEEFSKIERIGHMGHVREYAPADVRDLLEREGLVVERQDFSTFRGDVAPSRPILGRIGTAVREFVPFLKPIQITVAAKRAHNPGDRRGGMQAAHDD